MLALESPKQAPAELEIVSNLTRNHVEVFQFVCGIG